MSTFAQVHALVRRIPRGKVATYGLLSRLVGRRLSPVGIGWALRAAGEEIPWHRVVNAKGTLSTAPETAARQKRLLKQEGVRFGRDGAIDLARYLWRP